MRLPGWEPRDYRRKTYMSGTLVSADGRAADVKVTDLSQKGCKVSSPEIWRIGARLVLKVDGFEPVPVSVRWALNNKAGLRFEDENSAGPELPG